VAVNPLHLEQWTRSLPFDLLLIVAITQFCLMNRCVTCNLISYSAVALYVFSAPYCNLVVLVQQSCIVWLVDVCFLKFLWLFLIVSIFTCCLNALAILSVQWSYWHGCMLFSFIISNAVTHVCAVRCAEFAIFVLSTFRVCPYTHWSSRFGQLVLLGKPLDVIVPWQQFYRWPAIAWMRDRHLVYKG